MHTRQHIRFVSNLEVSLRLADQDGHMTRLELIPERRADGTIVLRAVERGPLERLKRFVRRLLPA
jgi:hypothetical protein